MGGPSGPEGVTTRDPDSIHTLTVPHHEWTLVWTGLPPWRHVLHVVRHPDREELPVEG